MRQRYVTGGVVAVAGVVLAAVQLWQGLLETERTVVLLFGTGPFLLLGLSLIYVGYWLTQAEAYEPDQTRILAWGLGGASLFLSIGALLLFNQRVHLREFALPLQTTADMLTLGTVVGIMVGLYDARNQEQQRQLAAQRDRIEDFATSAADLNKYGRALNECSTVDEVSALCIQGAQALLGLREAAVLEGAEDGYDVVQTTFGPEDHDDLEAVADEVAENDTESVELYEGDLAATLDGGDHALVGALVTNVAGPAVVLAAVGDPDRFEDEDLELLDLLVSHANTALNDVYTADRRVATE